MGGSLMYSSQNSHEGLFQGQMSRQVSFATLDPLRKHTTTCRNQHGTSIHYLLCLHCAPSTSVGLPQCQHCGSLPQKTCANFTNPVSPDCTLCGASVSRAVAGPSQGGCVHHVRTAPSHLCMLHLVALASSGLCSGCASLVEEDTPCPLLLRAGDVADFPNTEKQTESWKNKETEESISNQNKTE